MVQRFVFSSFAIESIHLRSHQPSYLDFLNIGWECRLFSEGGVQSWALMQLLQTAR